jgi:hypothetical protein
MTWIKVEKEEVVVVLLEMEVEACTKRLRCECPR